jgi:hypothetical protein
LYVWGLELAANTATIVTLQNWPNGGQAAAISGGYPLSANTPFTQQREMVPLYTVDPSGTLALLNSSSANVSGTVLWSN